MEENEFIEPEPEPEPEQNFETTKDVKTSINVMNTLENIINEIDYIMDPEEDGVMVKMAEDLGSGGGSGEETGKAVTEDPTDEMMTGIDLGLLEPSNDAIIVNNDVEILRFVLSIHIHDFNSYHPFPLAKWTKPTMLRRQTSLRDSHSSRREGKSILKRSTTQPVYFLHLVI